ncbi:hypothetical protein BP6252_10817 [Coleophoma cylindrospora]|uniref:Uncharacterized protein n=1 Tax=Coleophoma cylindrospora TaxID=1849047 RepID=A0A3D8QN96_9HELO|nr:hypothetical protein BP6252_10817 [Coleophoma cylindrospora]
MEYRTVRPHHAKSRDPAPHSYNGYITRVCLANNYKAYKAELNRDLKYYPEFSEITPTQWKVGRSWRRYKRASQPSWMYPANRQIILDEERHIRNQWRREQLAVAISYNKPQPSQQPSIDDSVTDVKDTFRQMFGHVVQEEEKEHQVEAKPRTSRLRKEKSLILDEDIVDNDDAKSLFNRQRYREQQANWPEIYCIPVEKEMADLRKQGFLKDDGMDLTTGDIALDDISNLHPDAGYAVKWKSPKRRARGGSEMSPPEPVILHSDTFSDEELAMLMETCLDLDWVLVSDDAVSSSESWVEVD